MTDRELSLFPLNVVLFPQMMLPLHVFEERYKEMVRACLDSDSRFGVVLIKEGQDVGAPAVPHSVGTMARISRVTPLEEGRLNLVVMGERRFQIIEVTQWHPYLKARISFPEEAAGEPRPTPEEIDLFRQVLEKHLRTLLGLGGGWVREVPCPTDPIELSFYTGAVLRGETDERQRILESPTAKERLALLAPFLQREYQRNRTRLEERLSPKGARLN